MTKARPREWREIASDAKRLKRFAKSDKKEVNCQPSDAFEIDY